MIEIDLIMTRNIPITKEKKKETKAYYTPTQYSPQKKEPINISSHLKESDFLWSG